MAKYLEDVEVLKISETDGYVWLDKETNKTWAVPLVLSGLIAPTLMMLPPRPETLEEKELRKENVRKAIDFARQRNNPVVVSELEKVLAKL
jgi:hypothetical protein